MARYRAAKTQCFIIRMRCDDKYASVHAMSCGTVAPEFMLPVVGWIL